MNDHSARLFGPPETWQRDVLAGMLRFEAALARVQGDLGVIPKEAVAPIEHACDMEGFDLGAVGRGTVDAGIPVVPFVKTLTARVEKASGGEAARYVHWGATSQDVLDTAIVLAARERLQLIETSLQSAADLAAGHARAHRGSVMTGRTWLQPALPISFGLKCAGWLAGIVRARTAVRRSLREDVALQFGGASGTMASLGERGAATREGMGEALDLPVPPMPWHAERSRVVQIGGSFALVCGAAGKIATDVALMMQAEVAEAFEGAAEGKGSSSTMPHKRNPAHSAQLRANALRAPGLLATLHAAMLHEHERGAGTWNAEWEPLGALAQLATASAGLLRQVLEGMEVDRDRMAANLDDRAGLPLAESLMMALAPHVGRMEAHRLVGDAARRAAASDRTLSEAAREDEAIASRLDADEITAALAPAGYLGAADTFLDAMLHEHERMRDADDQG